MEERTLNFIATACAGRLINAPADAAVRGIATDSRAVRPGELFAALSGPNFDAHDFLVDVCSKGAAAALVEEKRVAALPSDLPCVVVPNTRIALGMLAGAYREQFDLTAIAVAGSNGKTSTKEMVASVLRQKIETLASAASFNNEIGVPLTLLQAGSQHRAGVFEVGTNHPGELRPLLKMVHPDAGIITSIGREHLEFFGTLESVLQEEGTLAEMLPSRGFLVIHGEGFGAEALAARSAARVIRVGSGSRNEWRVADIRMEKSGTRFSLSGEDSNFEGEYHIQLFGAHQVVNATYAVVVGKELGLGRAEIQRGLASCTGAKRRMELKQIDDFWVLDDAYNANADSMQAALDTLQNFPCRGRRIAVLGEMAELGESSVMAHEEIGRRAAAGKVDFLVTVGNSRKIMAKAARGAGLRHVVELAEADQAGPAVTEMVRPGDLVLIKASRSARLERVVDFLAARFATPGHSGPRPEGS
ncbi:MAG TPA: UDP-N-acetylmuramoyl-tripeptide--D-alanyl-D-alanine ligase [Verrucomicrobiae bacterium]|nr:UDP-N-acetylmuramoyl-tripeptide--D-alanyl-D-alanine ligase [Verrucomicrobiae bacterium]